MSKTNNNWGGFREGGGRPRNNRTRTLCVNVSPEAMEALTERTGNKSEFIDNLLLNLPPGIDQHGLMPIRKTKE